MKWLRRNWIWIAATLLLAAAVHLGSVMLLPRAIMVRTMGAIATRNGFNTMAYGPRPTAASRGVVRPSPDLLYASCVYDLDSAGGVLRVHASGMPKTYWSVSLFDADTNNFYVVNDRKAGGDGVDFLIIAPGAFVDGTHLPVVVAPTMRGLVLFRTFINDEKRFADIDRARRGAKCEAFSRP